MKRAHLKAVQPVLMAQDVLASVKFYLRLGFEHTFGGDEIFPRYAAVRRDAVELHLQWQDQSQWRQGMDRPTYRFVVDDVDELHSELQSCGLQLEITPVRDTNWGTREFHVRDPDGNSLQFYRDL